MPCRSRRSEDDVRVAGSGRGLDHDLDPAIELPAGFVAVVRARLELAASERPQPARRHAERRQLIAHGHRAAFRELLVVALGADRIGMTDDRDLVAVVLLRTSACLCMVGLKAGLIAALSKSNEISLDS